MVKTILNDLFNITSKGNPVNLPAHKEIGLNISYNNVKDQTIVYNNKEPVLPFAESDVFNANVTNWRRLTADDNNCKSVYEITLNIKGSNFVFKPGDTIGVIPQNNSSEVVSIIEHLDLTAVADLGYELVIDSSLKGVKIPLHIPIKSTLRHVLTHCVDIRSVLKKLFLLALSKHTKHEEERKILEYLCSKEGSAAYNTHILNKNFSILDLFQTFNTCRPPVEVLLAHLPRLLPRPYSVINSQKRNEDVIKICFSVINLESGRKGLTTGYLEEMIMNRSIDNIMENLSIQNETVSFGKVSIYVRKNMSGFVSPNDPNKRLLLIGPGTGVAPFIGFLEERLLVKQNSAQPLGDVWLFFGCRNPKLDYLYEDELNTFVENGTLTKLITTFSRVENGGVKHVQDAILNHSKEVAEFVTNGAIVYVCGDLKIMAGQVRQAIKECISKHKNLSEKEAENLLDEMVKEKRYLVDIWN